MMSFRGEPGDWKLFLFSKSERILWRPLPAMLRRFFSMLLFGIAPGVPANLVDFLRPRRRRNAFILAAVVTFIAGFAVQVTWAVVADTFRGNDPKRLYLSADLPNLINFALVCPAYVGLAAVMFLLIGGYWSRLRTIPGYLGSPQKSVPSLSVTGAMAIVLAAGALNTCKYISECLDPTIYPRVPWYITRVMADGTRVLGSFGVYYTLLNFCLFVVVILALLAFLSFFGLAVRVASAIRGRPAANAIDFKRLKLGLEGFLYAYIVAKLIVAVLIVNFYTWRWAQPRGSFTLLFMGVALTVFGVVVASLPRYVLELEWFRFKLKNAIALGLQVDSLDSDDLRPVTMRVVAGLLDALFIGNFILSFVQAARS